MSHISVVLSMSEANDFCTEFRRLTSESMKFRKHTLPGRDDVTFQVVNLPLEDNYGVDCIVSLEDTHFSGSSNIAKNLMGLLGDAYCKDHNSTRALRMWIERDAVAMKNKSTASCWKFIIHAIVPGSVQRIKNSFARTTINVLREAIEHECSSLALPLLCLCGK